MIQDVISVQVQPNFLLLLEFKNGEQRSFDMKPLLSVKPWCRIASPEVFADAHVNYGTVVWPGELDIAPETLYDCSVPI